MATFDLVLLLFLAAFVLLGFFAGLFQTLGSILGAFLGYFAAVRLAEPVGEILQPLFFHNDQLAEAIAFILVFLLINRLIGLIFWVLAKAFQLLRFIPFVDVMNRIAGALLGFIEGMIVIGIIIRTMTRMLPDGDLAGLVSGSEIAQLLVTIAGWYDFVVPVGLRSIQSWGV